MSNNAKKYRVGYGRPPEATRFKPGQSGNPKGRPKGNQSMATIGQRELAQKVEVTENGKRKILSKAEILVKSQCALAAKGVTKSAEFMLKLSQSAELREQQRAGAQNSPPDDTEIINRYLASLLAAKGGDDEAD